MPNKLSQFWQELKRRKVTRVITVYAAAAFVIMELVDIIAEPLRLPEWFLTAVIIILCIGFIITVIFSWIYDIHPEGGIIKTEPAHKVKSEDLPKSSNSWKIASYISFVVIVGLIVLNIIPRTRKNEILNKSIAVLPFVNDSPEEENAYFINGIMEEILLNLQAIKELRVPGRTSVEKYRSQTKSIPEIAEELGVNYVVEGSGQKYGDKIVLRVQLLEGASDRHLWGDSYEEEINSTEVIFGIQSQIAQSIAAELKAVITPSEKELIEKLPTTNISAFDLYQRGNDAYWNYWSDNSNKKAFERAEYYFNEALKYDPTFAQAYTGLARIYWGIEGYFSENYLDTVRVLLDKALSFDPALAEAYTLKGRYFNELNDTIRAMREVDRAIALNPNDWEAYSVKADISIGFINKISNRQKAVLLNRGPELPNLLTNLGGSYTSIGFWDKATEKYEEALKLTGDSIAYFNTVGFSEALRGNFNRTIELYKKSLALDSTQLDAYSGGLFQSYSALGEIELALKYGKIWVEGIKASGELGVNYMHRVGYFYWLQGLEEEADYYFNLQIENCMREIELERSSAVRSLTTYYDLAVTYAFTGETEKALENLRIWITRPLMDAVIMTYLRNDPQLNPIRDNPEFQQILNEAEAKYQAEHERVRQWLEEKDML